MDLIFTLQANDREFFGRRRVPKGVPAMLRKTMIVLAKAAAFTSGLTVEAFAHGGGREHGGGFGGGGHMGGYGGARIGSGFGSGFAGSHFGAALGLALF